MRPDSYCTTDCLSCRQAAPSELPLIPIIAGAAGAVLLVVIVVIVVVVKKNKSNGEWITVIFKSQYVWNAGRMEVQVYEMPSIKSMLPPLSV